MSNPASSGQLITVFGGSGFLGRHLVRSLAAEGWRIRVACRRPDLAFHLQPLGRVGQIHAVQANVRNPASVAAALRGVDAAVNLTGVLTPSGRQSFEAVHTFGARAIARAAKEAGIAKLLHVSAIGADAQSPSAYQRSKAAGENAVLEYAPQAQIIRPSIIFGPEDDFFNRFAAIARMSPVLPLIGGGQTKFQPVFVGDIASAMTQLAAGAGKAGAVYEFGGPQVKTFEELLRYICEVTGRSRAFVPVPWGLAMAKGFALELTHKLSLGIWPEWLTVTRDQIRSLQSDNIVSETAIADGRTLQGLGVTPAALEAVVPTYLYRFRKAGQFSKRAA